MLTGRVVLVGLLEGVHGHLGPGGQEGHAAAQSRVHRQVVVVVQAAARLDDGQPLVSRVEDHLGMPAELGTWTHQAAKSMFSFFTSYKGGRGIIIFEIAMKL